MPNLNLVRLINKRNYPTQPGYIPTWSGRGWNPLPCLEELPMERLNKDANGIFTLVRHRRPDGTIHRSSEVSGGTSPHYTTRTVKYYDASGTRVITSSVFAMTYDGDDVVSEVLQ